MNQNLPLDVPILFLTFNRMETTRQVFSQISKMRPTQLYIASDGPRLEKPGEIDKVHEIRKYLLDNIFWRCEVHTLFRNENLGCGKAVSGAITWFFEQVESGIILEDDCLPSDSFFFFCRELLQKYKDNPQIMHITGTNPLDISLNGNDSYYFTKVHQCWGWATWRWAWQKYNFDIDSEILNKFLHSKNFKQFFNHIEERRYWRRVFRNMENHEIDTWDYQWEFAIASNGGLCINPCRNMVSNIGFSPDALHTSTLDSSGNNRLRYDIVAINHPEKIELNAEFSDRISEEHFNIAIHNLPKFYLHIFWRDFIFHPAKRAAKKILTKFGKN